MFDTVIFDIDNTLTDVEVAMRVLEREFDKDYRSVDNLWSFNFCETYQGITPEEERDFWERNESEIVEKAVLHPRVDTLLDTYTHEGTKILMLTARPERFREPTEKWLKQNGVPFDNLLCIGMGQCKADYIKEHFPDADALFEDSPRTLKRLTDSSIKTFAIDYPYNRGAPSDYRLCRETGEILENEE